MPSVKQRTQTLSSMPRIRRLAGVVVIAFGLPGAITNALWWGDAMGRLWSIVLLASGLFLLTVDLWGPSVRRWLITDEPQLPQVAHPTATKSEPPAHVPSTTPLSKLVERELVAIIDAGKALSLDGFTTPQHGSFTIWRDKTRAFVGTVLGDVERQRFDKPKDLASCLDHLANLRDRPTEWALEVDAEELDRAIEARRSVSEQERIVVADDPRWPREETNPDPEPWQPSHPDIRRVFTPYPPTPEPPLSNPYDAKSDPEGKAFIAALRKEKYRGARIQARIGKGGIPGEADGPATDAEVNGWEEDVCQIFEQRPRNDLMDRFMFDAPKKRTPVGTLFDGAIEVFVDRSLKDRMGRRMAALSGIIRDLEKAP